MNAISSIFAVAKSYRYCQICGQLLKSDKLIVHNCIEDCKRDCNTDCQKEDCISFRRRCCEQARMHESTNFFNNNCICFKNKFNYHLTAEQCNLTTTDLTKQASINKEIKQKVRSNTKNASKIDNAITEKPISNDQNDYYLDNLEEESNSIDQNNLDEDNSEEEKKNLKYDLNTNQFLIQNQFDYLTDLKQCNNLLTNQNSLKNEENSNPNNNANQSNCKIDYNQVNKHNNELDESNQSNYRLQIEMKIDV